MWWTGTSVDPARNRFRWYAIDLQPTLWGTWDCWASWGRIGQGPRGRKRVAEGSWDAVWQAAQRQRRRKERRGYQDR